MLMEIVTIAGFFIVCMTLLGALEYFWPAKSARPMFQTGWVTDVLHFFFSYWISRFIALMLVTFIVNSIDYPEVIDSFRRSIGASSILIQVVMVILIGDIVQYWMHRWMHEIPFLWKIHAIHHSSTTMDWLANARSHPIDQGSRRAFTLFALSFLGLSEEVLFPYWLLFAPLHSFFIHTNTSLRFPILRQIITTPEFHHWHHVTEPVNKNYASRLPFIDRIFGSYYLPTTKNPDVYGCADPVSDGYFSQLFYPFRKKVVSEPSEFDVVQQPGP